MSNKKCIWKPESEQIYDDLYDTQCGQSFVIIETTLKESGIKYCCFCGKEVANGKS